MSVRSRVAFASGTAGLAGAALVLSGQLAGSAVLVLFLMWAARAAPWATLAGAGPVLAAEAPRGLRREAAFAPAWALIVACGVLRAGSISLDDVRGAASVAGLPIARGAPVAVIGVWLAIAAGILAIASWTEAEGAETAASPGAVGRIVVPSALRRLTLGAAALQVVFLVSLFAGPQVTEVPDGVRWAGGALVAGAAAWLARGRVPARLAPFVASGLSLGGVALVIAGGSA